jgi:hypothetical protein
MHDNDPKHTARETREWPKTNNIKILDWLAQSPDLNPIENIWEILDKKIKNSPDKPINTEELWSLLQKEWYSMDKEIVRKLYLSMTSRINDLYNSSGGYTKY